MKSLSKGTWSTWAGWGKGVGGKLTVLLYLCCSGETRVPREKLGSRDVEGALPPWGTDVAVTPETFFLS